MNKEEYKSAIGKIRASDEFKVKVGTLMKLSNTRIHTFNRNWLVPVFAVILMFAFIFTARLPSLLKGTARANSIDGFKIIGSTTDISTFYTSVVYIDGYVYAPSEWFKYSRYKPEQGLYKTVRGDKLGEITLNLKDKKYVGIPPDFSGTLDIGTEIYKIENVKKERAILVVENNCTSIFYRERKAVLNEKTPINLTLSDVFEMTTDSLKVSAVELRDENDGSWMRTSEDEHILSLINNELPKLVLLNLSELGQNPYNMNYFIPINLIFSNGTVLHMQVFPKRKCAYVFGGYVNLSSELCTVIQKLLEQGEQYPSISDLLPYSESEISYLSFTNHTNGDEVLCKNPAWSSNALFGIFNYYRVEEVNIESGQRTVVTCIIGISKDKSVIVNFYKTEDKNIIIELKGHYYKPVKGQIVLDELEDYLYNSTDLRSKRLKQ